MTARAVLALAAAVAAPAAALTLPHPAGAGGSSCPAAVRPLASAPSGTQYLRAKRAAIRFAVRRYAPLHGYLTLRIGVTRARWAPAWRATRFIATVCGGRALRATVAMHVAFPVMFDDPHPPTPRCDHCAGVVVLVARGRGGWFAWHTL
jgi:hypothetical protein